MGTQREREEREREREIERDREREREISTEKTYRRRESKVDDEDTKMRFT